MELVTKGADSDRVFVCRSCDRRFKFDSVTFTTWAIARDENLSPLQDAVSSRWLSEKCIGQRRDGDEADFKRIKPIRTSSGSRKAG